MSSIIVLNKKNIVSNGFNNTLRYNFTNSSNFKDMELAVNHIQIYNSQFNITSAFNNNTFSVQVPTAATYQTVPISLPDGYYSYSDMTNYITNQLIAIGAYLIDNNANKITYIRISENPTYYSAQIDLLATPTSLPTGWSKPSTGLYSSTGTGLPTASNTPTITIPNNGFSPVVGFAPATYPSTSQTSNQSFLSTFTPSINPTSSYLVRCNLVNNRVSNPPDILTTFSTQGTTIGDLIDVDPHELSWVKVNDGAYANLTLTIVDQDFNNVSFKDPSILITLLLREQNSS